MEVAARATPPWQDAMARYRFDASITFQLPPESVDLQIPQPVTSLPSQYETANKRLPDLLEAMDNHWLAPGSLTVLASGQVAPQSVDVKMPPPQTEATSRPSGLEWMAASRSFCLFGVEGDLSQAVPEFLIHRLPVDPCRPS